MQHLTIDDVNNWMKTQSNDVLFEIIKNKLQKQAK